MPASFVTPQTIACQAPLSIGFPRQEYWSGLLFPSPGDLPDSGIQTGVSCIGRRILYHWATLFIPMWLYSPGCSHSFLSVSCKTETLTNKSEIVVLLKLSLKCQSFWNKFMYSKEVLWKNWLHLYEPWLRSRPRIFSRFISHPLLCMCERRASRWLVIFCPGIRTHMRPSI